MSWHSSSGHGNSETSLNSQITILFLCLSFVCLWNTTQQERTLRGRYTCCLVYGFLSDSGSMLLVCVEPFPSLPGFKNGDFHFCEGVSSSDTTDWPIRCMQSADVTFTHNLRSLGTSSKQMLKMVPGTTCYHRMENRKCALYCQSAIYWLKYQNAFDLKVNIFWELKVKVIIMLHRPMKVCFLLLLLALTTSRDVGDDIWWV